MGREGRNTLVEERLPTRGPWRPGPAPRPRLRPDRMPDWIDQELATLDLGDDRLHARQKLILDRFAANPSASIPAACRRWAETNGAYRFFAPPRVPPEEVLPPHRQAPLARIAEHPVVLLPQDTTELDFTRPKEVVDGAGPLNWVERTGFLQHAQLAVTPERLPLGVLDADTWGRDADDHGKHVRRKHEPIERKESYRWLEGYRRACAVAEAVPGTRIVSIADREGDIYECLAEAQTIEGRRAEWIIRSCQDRSTTKRSDEGDRFVKLRETVAARPVLGRLTGQVPRTEKGPARAATMAVRSATVELKPPYRPDRKLPAVTVNAVLIREESPPAGVKPIEWLLLTSLQVATFAEAATVVDYYSGRWPVEI